MKTTAAIVIACALAAGCGGSEPPPKPATPAAPAKTENLTDLLKRADAEIPKNAPDTNMSDRAEQMFGRRISGLSSQKANVESLNATKDRACQQKSDTAACKATTSQWEQANRSYRQAFEGMEVEASRAGISPTVMRELYSRHGFSPN
jgi:hypothetical protein